MSIAKRQNDLNAVIVTVADLRSASEAVHALLPEDRDWEGRLMAMVRLFPGNPDKGLAVEYRLVAMARMLEAGVLPGWATPEASDGSMLIAEPVWTATATEPIILGKHEARFDQRSFLTRVLSMAAPEGNA
ncbi:hypothetical protein [Pseudoxanthomonas wuyuanensis]